MKKLLVALSTLAVAALLLPASPASAEKGTSPAAYCREAFGPLEDPMSGLTVNVYVVPVEFSFGGETAVEDFALHSFQACVSTVASGLRNGVVPASKISKPAYLARCQNLEDMGAIEYPYSFYGLYPAENRADCARILQGVHSGTLALPGPPPVG